MDTSVLLNKLNYIEHLLTQQVALAKHTLSFKEACTYMGISASFLYKLTSTRAIPHFCPNGKMLFFNRVDLDAWMQRNPQRTVYATGQSVIRPNIQKGGGAKHV